MFKFWAATLLAIPMLAHAGCEDRMSTWAQALHPGREIAAADSACKVWSADNSLTLAVLAFKQKTTDPDAATYDVDVLVAKSDTGEVLAHLYRTAALTEDAVMIQSVGLDMARYQLAPDTRAFGVRTVYEGSSRVNPFGNSVLDLYVVQGHTLKRVLSNLQTHIENGDWDGNCAGTFTTVNRVISVDPTQVHGYATLRVSQKSGTSNAKMSGDQCVSRDVPPVRADFTLQYDGTQYEVPKKLSFEE
jgi:hypothetical protein